MEIELPPYPDDRSPKDDDREPLYAVDGPADHFRSLTIKYYMELEMELGNENPQPLFHGALLVKKGQK
jgi:hypothetical protein